LSLRLSLKRLTDIQIRSFQPPEKGQKVYYEPSGLGLRVSQGGTKSFVTQLGNSRKRVTLGRYPQMTLQDARKELLRLQSEKVFVTKAPRLSVAMDAYLTECERKNKASTIHEYRRMLSLIKDMPLDRIKVSDLANPTDHQIMAWRIFFNWCVKRQMATSNPFVHVPIKSNQRSRVLTDDEVKRLWAYDHRPYSTILRLLLLTGQRRSQIWKLQPDWIRGDRVTFPEEIMKSNRLHEVPFGPQALALATEAPFSFNGWSKAKRRADKHTGITDWTVHDLRRTFATLNARIGTPIHVTEACLDHSSGTISGVAAIYIRHDFMKEMREAILRYEDFIHTLVSP
jgi:integrase